MTCEVCGGRSHLMHAEGDRLRCDHCGYTVETRRPPLMIVTGAAGSGKSTLCQRLARSIGDVVAIDVDIFDGELASVVTPNHDYPAFWRSLMRLAHEIGENGLPVVYCGVMLPDQVLTNADMLALFRSVHFLGLVSDDEVLRNRISRRVDAQAAVVSIDFHLDFNARIRACAPSANMTLIDAGLPRDEVEVAATEWIRSVLDDTASHAWVSPSDS